MKIIYISAMISEKKFAKIFKYAKEKPLQSIQKYHRLLCKGFVLNNIETKAVSIIPMSRKISDKFLFFDKKETENDIKYTYVPFINILFIRQIFTFFFSFIKIFSETIKSKKTDLFICDILNTNLSIATILMCKLFRRQSIALVTDLPRDINSGSFSSKVNEFFQSKYDGYILLTKYMNEVVNKKNKPYIVIEGLVNSDNKIEFIEKNQSEEKICVYAGGIYEKYGIKSLIDAFELLPSNYKLYLYGEGEMKEFLKTHTFTNVKYKGVVPNNEMLEIQKKATLLLNPRFSDGDYTKYSFPSKIIEYMSSGTPVLTTKLKGIPKEYNNYLYFFDSETVDGLKCKLMEILNKSIEEQKKFGMKAQEFVIKNKNNKIQAKKIIDYFKL